MRRNGLVNICDYAVRACPRCNYPDESRLVTDRCPECGLHIGSNAISFRGRPGWSRAIKLFYFAGAGLLALAWAGTVVNGGSWGWWKLCSLGVASIAVVYRIVGFFRFVHCGEYLLLNSSGIHWAVQGEPSVSLCWADIEEVRSWKRLDWLVLKVKGRRRVHYVPARFRPRCIGPSELTGILGDYRTRYGLQQGFAGVPLARLRP